MPIVRNYGPSGVLAGALAFKAGQGDFRQRQDQFQYGAALNAAQLALQARDADRRFFVAEQSRNDQQAYQAAALANQQAQIAARQQAQQQEFGQRLALEQVQQQGQRQYLADQTAGLMARDEQQWQRQQVPVIAEAELLNQQLDDAIAEIRQMQVTPEGERIRSKFIQKADRIREAGKLLPAGSTNAPLRNLLSDIGRANLGQFEQKPFNLQEHAAANVIRADQVVPGMEGYFYVDGQRNGSPSMRYISPLEISKPEKQEKPAEKPHPLIDDKPPTYESLEKRALSQLQGTTVTIDDGKDENGNSITRPSNIWDETPDDKRPALLTAKIAELSQQQAQAIATMKTAAADVQEQQTGGGQEFVAATYEDLASAPEGVVQWNGRRFRKYADGSYDPLD